MASWRWHRLQRPWISLFLLTMLAADASRLPWNWWKGGSTFKQWLSRPLDADVNPAFLPLVLRDGAWQIGRGFSDRQADMVISPGLHVREAGFWWPTVRRTTFEPRILQKHTDRVLTPDDQAAIRGVVCDWLGKAAPDGGREGNIRTTTILWRSVARNTAASLILVCFLLSLGWVERVSKQRWRRAFAKPGECARCRYDLAGLVTPLCPECGTKVVPAS